MDDGLVYIKTLDSRWFGLRGYVTITTKRYVYRYPTMWYPRAEKLYDAIRLD